MAGLDRRSVGDQPAVLISTGPRHVITFVGRVIGRFMTQSTRADGENWKEMGRLVNYY